MDKRPRQKIDLALVLLAAGVLPALGAPAEKALSIPQFGFADYAWSKVSDDFQAIEGAGPGPVTYDKSSPYTNNQRAGAGRPITLRIADLSNPILKPSAIESMRKANELAAAGKAAYEARASCRPGGVPGFLVMGRVNPMYIVQGPKEVVLINEGGQRCGGFTSTFRIRRVRRSAPMATPSAITRVAIRSWSIPSDFPPIPISIITAHPTPLRNT